MAVPMVEWMLSRPVLGNLQTLASAGPLPFDGRGKAAALAVARFENFISVVGPQLGIMRDNGHRMFAAEPGAQLDPRLATHRAAARLRDGLAAGNSAPDGSDTEYSGESYSYSRSRSRHGIDVGRLGDGFEHADIVDLSLIHI